jgi:hypothetical protein
MLTVPTIRKETQMTVLLRSATSLIALATGLVLAAGVYTEAHRAPDQP